jgi:hypothetical protein
VRTVEGVFCDYCGSLANYDQADDWPRVWIVGANQKVRLNHPVNDFCSPLCAGGFAKRVAEREKRGAETTNSS